MAYLYFKKLLLSMIVASTIIHPGNVITTDYKNEADEAILWEILLQETKNEVITAGCMGYIWRESFYRSDSVVGWHYIKAVTGEDPCQKFTEDLNSMTKDEFISYIQKAGGYGLGQWYSEGYLGSLYDFCKGYGTSFDDALMQCKFLVHSLKQSDIWPELIEVTDPVKAGRIIAYGYDGTGEDGAVVISSRAEKIYQKYHS